MQLQCLLLVAVACFMDTAMGYSNGKVTVSCGNMKPQHGKPSRTDPPPYSITVDVSVIVPGKSITVTLQASRPHHSFKGFLMEARDVDRPNAPALGSFRLVDPGVSQLLDCGDVQAHECYFHIKTGSSLKMGSGVSHTSGSDKEMVQAMWECPERLAGRRVQFFATVVKKHKSFWVKIPGPVLSIKGATVLPTRPVSSASPKGATTASTALPTAFSSDGCGSSKSCLRDPVGCHPESNLGCFFLSFAPNAAGEGVLFELSGPSKGYVAFAFSLDKWMGNDDVYLCIKDEGRIVISAGYVSGRTEPELAQEGALQDKAWSVSNGMIQCSFSRNVFLSQLGNRFNLDQSYFLFLAHGSIEHGSILKHGRQPLISTIPKVITGPPENLSGSRSPLLIKFHGGMMLMAWMWAASTGVLFARHFKHPWSDAMLCGHRLWFQVHRGLMCLAVCLISVAFSLPFLYRAGWSDHAGLHPYLGCTVMALSVIQPIMAVFRPAPQSSRRYLFNGVHLTAGTLVQILAVVCIFLGFEQQALLITGPGPRGALVGWLLWILSTDLVLKLHTSFMTNKGNGDIGDEEGILFAMPEGLQQRGRKEVSKFSVLVMTVFQFGNVGFFGTMINAIANV